VDIVVNEQIFATHDNFRAVHHGRHSLSFRSTDVAGLTEAADTTSVRVDTSPPRFVSVGPGGILTNADVSVSWTAIDDVAGNLTYNASVDGAATVSLGTVDRWSLFLPDGKHEVRVEATDDAGNVAVDVIAFRVDTNPFSLSGPFQGIPTYLLIELLAGLAAYGYLRRRRRRRTMRASPHYR